MGGCKTSRNFLPCPNEQTQKRANRQRVECHLRVLRQHSLLADSDGVSDDEDNNSRIAAASFPSLLTENSKTAAGWFGDGRSDCLKPLLVFSFYNMRNHTWWVMLLLFIMRAIFSFKKSFHRSIVSSFIFFCLLCIFVNFSLFSFFTCSFFCSWWVRGHNAGIVRGRSSTSTNIR